MVSLPLEPAPVVETVKPRSFKKIWRFLTWELVVYGLRVEVKRKVESKREVEVPAFPSVIPAKAGIQVVEDAFGVQMYPVGQLTD